MDSALTNVVAWDGSRSCCLICRALGPLERLAQKEIGVGAAVGGPLVLSTISYAVVGVVLWCSRHKLRRPNTELQLDTRRLSSDHAWFLLIIVALALGLVSLPFKRWLGVLLFGAYSLYIWREMTAGHGREHDDEQVEPRQGAEGRGEAPSADRQEPQSPLISTSGASATKPAALTRRANKRLMAGSPNSVTPWQERQTRNCAA
jgi:Ca2+/Na+ antiporter